MDKERPFKLDCQDIFSAAYQREVPDFQRFSTRGQKPIGLCYVFNSPEQASDFKQSLQDEFDRIHNELGAEGRRSKVFEEEFADGAKGVMVVTDGGSAGDIMATAAYDVAGRYCVSCRYKFGIEA